MTMTGVCHCPLQWWQSRAVIAGLAALCLVALAMLALHCTGQRLTERSRQMRKPAFVY
jgi:hypothetical protein